MPRLRRYSSRPSRITKIFSKAPIFLAFPTPKLSLPTSRRNERRIKSPNKVGGTASTPRFKRLRRYSLQRRRRLTERTACVKKDRLMDHPGRRRVVSWREMPRSKVTAKLARWSSRLNISRVCRRNYGMSRESWTRRKKSWAAGKSRRKRLDEMTGLGGGEVYFASGSELNGRGRGKRNVHTLVMHVSWGMGTDHNKFGLILVWCGVMWRRHI